MSQLEEQNNKKPELCLYSCEKYPSGNNRKMEDYCTKVYKMYSCSDLNEGACKKQNGCRWEKK